MAGGIARGDVRLYSFAPPDKKRPVVVLTRPSAIAYLSTVTVAPITTAIRGVPSEVVLSEEDGMKASCAVNLHNAVTVSQDRLGAAGGPSESHAHERDLCRIALLSGLRSRSLLAKAETQELTPLRLSSCNGSVGCGEGVHP